MGIFDVFTGDPAKDAAAKNTALLQQNQATGTSTLQQGQTGALGALDAAKGTYTPLQSKYGAATNLGLDALGVNGAVGNTRATDAFHAGPGYQYSVDQAEQGVLRNANATGGVNGGNTLAALSDRAGNMANQEYQNWVTGLNGYVSPEMSAASGAAGAEAAKAPVYTGTASNIANLGTSTTNGITGQNTQAANAEMQGSSNLWGLGLNLAKLGVGAATGGTSLLGGGGAGGIASTMNVGGNAYPAFR